MNAAAIAQRQMARRLVAGVEVLMKPAAAGAVDAAGFPFDLDDIFGAPGFKRMGARLLGPKEHIAGGLQAEQNCPSAVVVRFVITRRGPLGQVADQTISGDFKLSDAYAGAFDFALVDV